MTRKGKRANDTSTAVVLAAEGGNGPGNRHWRGQFLAILAETSNVSHAIKKTNTCSSRVYEARRKDADFRRKWHEALCEGYDQLEMDVLRRLREGDFKDKNDGKFDFANALRVLSAHRQTVSQQRARDSDLDEETVLASLNEKLDRIRNRERAVTKLLKDEGVHPVGTSDGDQ